MSDRLFQREAPAADLLISGARLHDASCGLDGAQLDVLITGGRIAEIGESLSEGGAEVIDGSGLAMLPGMVDPHVHLRTPGRRGRGGHRLGHAGRRRRRVREPILAMPNTRPVVDSAPVLGGLIERAREQAAVPTRGSSPPSRTASEGRTLVEMGELAARGAAGFSDDGRPVESAGLLRRALQYSRITGLKLTLHEEDLTLGSGGQMHEGAVAAELGLQGHPSIAESVMVARDLLIARHEAAPLHLCHISAAESVAEIRRAKELGVEVTAEVTPHHLCLTDEAVRSLDPNTCKMNPPLRSAEDRAALIEALADGTLDCIATDHAPHRGAGEGGAVRGRPQRRDRPRDRVPGGLHQPGRPRPGAAAGCRRADVGRAGQGVRAPAAGASGRRGRRTWPCGISMTSWRVEPPYASRSRNACVPGHTLQGRCT